MNHMLFFLFLHIFVSNVWNEELENNAEFLLDNDLDERLGFSNDFPQNQFSKRSVANDINEYESLENIDILRKSNIGKKFAKAGVKNTLIRNKNTAKQVRKSQKPNSKTSSKNQKFNKNTNSHQAQHHSKKSQPTGFNNNDMAHIGPQGELMSNNNNHVVKNTPKNATEYQTIANIKNNPNFRQPHNNQQGYPSQGPEPHPNGPNQINFQNTQSNQAGPPQNPQNNPQQQPNPQYRNSNSNSNPSNPTQYINTFTQNFPHNPNNNQHPPNLQPQNHVNSPQQFPNAQPTPAQLQQSPNAGQPNGNQDHVSIMISDPNRPNQGQNLPPVVNPQNAIQGQGVPQVNTQEIQYQEQTPAQGTVQESQYPNQYPSQPTNAQNMNENQIENSAPQDVQTQNPTIMADSPVQQPCQGAGQNQAPCGAQNGQPGQAASPLQPNQLPCTNGNSGQSQLAGGCMPTSIPYSASMGQSGCTGQQGASGGPCSDNSPVGIVNYPPPTNGCANYNFCKKHCAPQCPSQCCKRKLDAKMKIKSKKL